ncbi:hypothetical protein PAAG_07361 [Paracoccidioides lutzii Pb01]|uniref:Uncharacterized protein n=1 Tax=Paracoccidioides lutzii (strain ATCC MYA-826 / Pb01) TaxID=502779 RepID=C1H9C0_PARBA|nr:hypothetical protein PAAG_07361 [Paracoccidioides lutzii Pb01]EEH36943.2 hypothetical protein PAAG_07361 [Paracoccidioides lutzii Pb01]
MAAMQFYSNTSLDTEDDDEILEKAKETTNSENSRRKFARQRTPYMVKMAQGHRLIVSSFFVRKHQIKFPGALGLYKAGRYHKNGMYTRRMEHL